MAQTVQQLPADGYVRLSQIIGDKDADPPIPPVIPVSKSTWWQGVKTGRFPKPVKLGPRITVWRVGDIRALLCLLLCLCSILMYVPDSQAVGLVSCTDRCPPLEKRKVVLNYCAGETARNIARRFNRNRTTVANLLKAVKIYLSSLERDPAKGCERSEQAIPQRSCGLPQARPISSGG